MTQESIGTINDRFMEVSDYKRLKKSNKAT